MRQKTLFFSGASPRSSTKISASRFSGGGNFLWIINVFRLSVRYGREYHATTLITMPKTPEIMMRRMGEKVFLRHMRQPMATNAIIAKITSPFQSNESPSPTEVYPKICVMNMVIAVATISPIIAG